MFTGLVDAVGRIVAAEPVAGGIGLRIEAPYRDLVIGESVAVDGACLTVAAISGETFSVQVVRTSLDRTNFGDYTVARRVNLERALRAGDRLGGHLVQGHVDGVGIVRGVAEGEDARLIDLVVPDEVARVSIPLGSVTVDGVSLTINRLDGPVVQVSLVPHTLAVTTLGDRGAGDRVHLEADLVGKYLRQFVDRPESGRE